MFPRRLKMIAAIWALGFMFLASCAGLVMWSVDRLVQEDAESTAHAWSQYLSENLDDIKGLADGKPLSWNDSIVIGNIRAQRGVLRFKLATPDGRTVFLAQGDVLVPPASSSSQAGDSGGLSLASAQNDPVVFMRRTLTGNTALPQIHADVAFPVFADGQPRLFAEASIDQSKKQALYRDHSLIAGLILSLIVLGAFGIPSVLLFKRLREIEQKDRDVVEHNERLNVVLENMTQGFSVFDADHKLVFCNSHYATIYGLNEDLVRPGTDLRDILEHRIAHGNFASGDPKAYIDERMAAIANAKATRSSYTLNDGRTIVVAHKPLPSGGWLTVHDDVSELRKAEERVNHLAHHDILTDLPNRELFYRRVSAAIPLAHRGNGFAVLCLNLDHFKNINDTLGYPVGDEVLKLVAERLRGCVRNTDTLARLGGDEFAIVQVPVKHPDEVTALAGRVCEVLKAPFTVGGHKLLAGVSVGIALAPGDGMDPGQLLKNADMALSRAKIDGRGVYRFFEPGMDQLMKERRSLEADLRAAVQEGQFELHYQPLFNARTSEVTGFEALIRWNHPTRGMVSPAEFIPMAEDIGLIVPMGAWVLREACAQAIRWPEHTKIAVNLSAVQFKTGDLVATVLNTLGATGLEASRLELEITETALLQDNEATIRMLHMLRGLGVRIAMDDFGTGYSSLSYLRSFPFDKIKLDGSFIKDLDHGEDATAIIRAVASLGKNLGMTTTAEGVETLQQLEKVRSEGYDEIQGYYFSPPRPAAKIEAMYFSQREKAKAIA